MAEQHLDDADVGACFREMGGKAVAQGVDAQRPVAGEEIILSYHGRGLATEESTSSDESRLT
jgi:hypothetical protein